MHRKKKSAGYSALLLLWLLAFTAKAGIITRNNALNGTAISAGAILVLQEDLYNYTTANPNPAIWNFADKAVNNKVFLRFTGANKAYYSSAWSITVNVKIEGYTELGSALPIVNTPLQISYDPTAPYKDIAAYAMTGAHRIKTTITGVTLSTGLAGVVPSDVVLENEMEIERYYTLPYILNSPSVPTINKSSIASNNSVEIYWDYVTGAEEYDMEYIFVSQYLSPQPSTPASADFGNATRISTKDNYYKLNLAFDNGKVFYRFRAVGAGGPNFDQRLESQWIYCSSPVVISTNFHTLSNWNYDATFAEGGRSAEAVSFFDGSQRTRQRTTLNNSDDVSLITESFYDFEGRPAISTLPAPTAALTNKLGYYASFNLNSSGSFYRKYDFEDGTCSNNYPMSTSAGASNYYSPANAFYVSSSTDKSFYPALPDAFQYPMIRTSYNNESEKLATSGLGADFKLGSGKETFTFKAAGSQEKLDRLFGNEVGYAQHYSEEVTIDPNGQTSVAYKNLSGKVIATALRGNAPANLTGLDPANEPYLTPEFTREDLIPPNQFDPSKNGFVLSKDFVVTNAGTSMAPNPYIFKYAMSPQTFMSLCVTNPFPCKYLLKISIMDNCGNVINALAPNASLLNTYIPIDATTYPSGYSVNFTVNFPANGVYKIQKELILDPAMLKGYMNTFSLAANSCVTPFLQMVSETLGEMDPNECRSCDAIATDKTNDYFANKLHITPPPTSDPLWQQTYQQIYDETCRGEAPQKSCDGLLALLKQDVSPGGQYFDLAQYDWIAAIQLANLTFATDFQNYCSMNNCAPAPPPSITKSWLIANWNDCFAGFLVQYHPEYCRYERCVALQPSDSYDYLLQTLNYSSAQTIDPYGVACGSPGCGVLNTVSTPFGNSVLGQDPIFSIDPAQAAAIASQLSNCTDCATMLNSSISGCTPAGTTMWDYTSCVPVQLNPLAPNYLDLRWKNFVTLYTSCKKKQQVSFMCPALIDADGALPPDLISDGINSGNLLDYWAAPAIIRVRANGMAIRDPDLVTILQNVSIDPYNPPTPDPNDVVGCTYTNPPTSPSLMRAFLNEQLPEFAIPGSGSYPFPGPTDSDPCTGGQTHNGIRFSIKNVPGTTGLLYISDRINIPDSSLSDIDMLTLMADEINSYISTPDFTALVDETGTHLQVFPTPELLPVLYKTSTQLELWAKRYEFCTQSDSAQVDLFALPVQVCPPPPPECICVLLAQLSDAYDAASSTLSVSRFQYMADKLNEMYYGGSPVITATQTQYWYTNCEASAYTPYPVDSENDPVYPPLFSIYIVPDQIDCEPPCDAQGVDESQYTAQSMYEQQLLESLNGFVRDFTQSCLTNLKEKFNVEYYEKEYHYTLYYYDQAGNLVRTVPPAAVKRIPSGSLYTGAGGTNMVNNSRLANTGFIYTGNTRFGQVSSYPSAANALVTNYQYNSYNQLKKQESPDGGSTNFWYDDLGRLRFSQNSKQAAAGCYSGGPCSWPFTGLYSYTLYDNLNRIIEVGENQDPYRITLPTLPPTFVYSTFDAGVNNQGFPSFNGIEVTKTYYSAPLAGNLVAAQFSSGQNNLRNRVSSSTYEDVEDNNDNTYQHATHYSYDIHGNVKSLVQENPSLGSLNQHYKRTDYEYDLISGKVNTVTYQAGERDAFYHKYYYDAANRLTSAYSSYNNVIWNREARYFYYLHGPLARVETGNEKVQGMDYVYTLQGWQKLANSGVLDATIDLGQDGNNINSAQYIASQPDVHDNIARDAFGFALDYYNTDYRSIQSGLQDVLTANLVASAGYNSTPGLFNGNIRALTQAFANPLSGQPVPVMSRWFTYDQLNRINSSDSYLQTTTSNNLGISLAATTDYKETFGYDPNGNILTALRNGYTGGFTNSMDNMSYAYTAGSNKLDAVADAGDNSNPLSNFGDIKNQAAGNYAYDNIGNLTADAQSNIASIEWTVYGKIKRITRSSGGTVNEPDLEFQYDAAGNRVCKISKPRVAGVLSTQENWDYTYYIRDAQGNVLGTYARKYSKTGGSYQDDLTLTEQHLYGSSRLGLLNRSQLMGSKAYNFVTYDADKKLVGTTAFPGIAMPVPNYNLVANSPGNKLYELNNHLGNAISVITDRKLAFDPNNDLVIDYYTSNITQSRDYYAFGAIMPGRNFSTANYRYGFNGKENDNEVKGTGNQQDYGMRIYDPRIGRFLSVDPITSEYPELTPYQFGSNRPIDGIDLDGLEWYKFKLTEQDGKPVLKTTSAEVGFETAVGFKLYEDKTYSVEYNDRFYSFSTPEEMSAFVTGDHAGYQTDVEKYMPELVNGFIIANQMYGEALNDAANSALSKNSVNDYDPVVVPANKQQANSNNGVKSDGSKATGPTEAYNRNKHYGKTPTAADRKALGAGKGQTVDHTTPLVKHYYEGDGQGGKPGYQMSGAERKAFAKDRSKMQVHSDKDSDSQGGTMSNYSKEKKKEYKLK